jgi:hypothetical protein
VTRALHLVATLLDVEAFDPAVHEPPGALNELGQNRDQVPCTGNFMWSVSRNRLRAAVDAAVAANA